MISLIIPCFNEEKNLEKLLSKLDLLLNENSTENIEIVIVNNGSTDNSETFIKKHSLYLKNKINLLTIDKNIGYGDGINKGINHSNGEILCWFHADLQFDPFDAIKIYKNFKSDLYNQQIMIKGRRINRSFFDSFFSFGMSLLTYLLFKEKINDINAQPKMFNRNFLKLIENPPIDFSYDVYFLLIAAKNNIKINEFPVKWYDRNAGIAKGGGSFKLKISLTFRTIKFMYNLKKKIF
tara:strand:- start:2493 stop:3203 length:711 start_codon:yes stop_codon:yes gene_type:complete